MDNQFNSPAEVVKLNIKWGGEGKATLPLGKMILLGIMAGAFIALGGAASSVAAHSITNVGLARVVTGAIFPVGLMMVVFIGGELFTGNCMIVMAVLNKKTTWLAYLRNLVVVYFSNLTGALIIDILVVSSGQFNYTDGLLGAYAIKTALAKVSITPAQAVASGILCNILVCIAILMATAAKDIAGKVWGIFFPIWAFVIGGYEHCVANMFYIPVGMLAAHNPDYVAKASEAYGITTEQISTLTISNSLHNFIPVTIGNIIGGAVFIGYLCYQVHMKKWGKKKHNLSNHNSATS